MSKILAKIDNRFRTMLENADDLSWKSPAELKSWMDQNEVSPGYHALRAIAGPATDQPVWARDWTAPNGHTYHKGEPAPHWTDQELHLAMAPQIMMWARNDARRAAGSRHGARQRDDLIRDSAANIHLQMQRALQQEKDEGRVLSGGGFVSWITSIIKQSGRTGVGGTNAERNAKGRVGDLLKTKNPKQAMEIADSVGEMFRDRPSHKEDPGNPYGQFSPSIHQLAVQLARSLESGDPNAVDQVRSRLQDLDVRIRDSETLVQGTDTGRRDISTPHGGKEGSEAKADLDKFMRTGIGSVDAPVGDNGSTVGANIVGDKGLDMSGMDKEVIYKALELGRAYSHEQNPKIIAHLQREGLHPIGDGDFRYLIRLLSPWLPDGSYPGKGKPGMDPEMDEQGNVSNWIKNDQPHLMERGDIMQDIASGGPGGSGEFGLDQIANMASPPLTPVQADFVALICGVNPDSPGQKMTQAAIARFREVSKPRVSQVVAQAAAKLGKTMAEVVELVQASGGSGEVGSPKSPVSKDPLGVFQRWMQNYMEEQELDESVHWVDKRIVAECFGAVTRLLFWTSIKPIIEGRAGRIILSRKVKANWGV